LTIFSVLSYWKQRIFLGNIPCSTWKSSEWMTYSTLNSLHFCGTLGSKWADLNYYHLAWLYIGTLWISDYCTMVPEESENPWQMVVVTCHQRDWSKNSWYHHSRKGLFYSNVKQELMKG
jgi:hypothetical protein